MGTSTDQRGAMLYATWYYAEDRMALPGCDAVTNRAQRVRATSVAQYVRTISAPARRIPVSVSRMARSRSIQPFAAAASTIAYSPETWYAATGTSDTSATARSTSR